MTGLDWKIGTFQGGPTLLPSVWERSTHIFEVDPLMDHVKSKFPLRPLARDWSDMPRRTPREILNRFPIDVLIIDHSRDYLVAAATAAPPVWYGWLEASDRINLPKILIQLWPQRAAASEKGPLDALQRKFLGRLGYESQYDLLDTVLYGSPVSQKRLVILSTLLPRDVGGETATAVKGSPIWSLREPDNLPPRPMSNCLRPFGAGKVCHAPADADPSVPIPNSTTDPMPNCAGAWIKTPTGFRRLFADELAKGLGVPVRWTPPTRRQTSVSLNFLPGTHAWEAIGNSVATLLAGTTPLRPLSVRGNGAYVPPVSVSKWARTGLSCAPFTGLHSLVHDDLPCQEGLPAGEQGNGATVPPALAVGSTEGKRTCVETDRTGSAYTNLPSARGNGAPVPPVPDSNEARPGLSYASDVGFFAVGHDATPCHGNLPARRGNGATVPPVFDPTPTTSLLTFEKAPGGSNQPDHWEWSVPDIRPNRAWHKRRIQTLKQAVRTYPIAQQSEMLVQGKADLVRHRANYGDEGATYLQVLWWEFPPEHWEPLRVGCSMNFLEPPSVTIMPNGCMTLEQTSIANEFFEELINLSVLEWAPDDDPILGNAPLFCIPKAGQPGQWRVLANMKEGRQNDSIGNEPVYLPRVSTILPHLYSGGWSATVDASKFFYQFPTVVSERKYLGCIHPTTGLHYRYRGLPMGAGNSPAIAGRMGATVLRLLHERHPALFGGEPFDNTWQTTNGLEETRHTDTRYGQGRVLLNVAEDGSPAVLTWVHVDDFFLHGPTFNKTAAALSAFMDLALELGLLCNPAKTVPPTQIVKYCGFLYDTTAEPMLVIPPEKRSRARVQVQYTIQKSSGSFSRLALSVVNGVLQSLVDATPTRIGQTYLRALHDLISTDNDVVDPTARFYTMCTFTPEARDSLRWWEAFLAFADSRPIRPTNSATIGCAWGDGSGTGTGGTTELLGEPSANMRMWMGTWAPHVHQFSSNWRELKTLLLTLEQEVDTLKAAGTSRFANMTLLYFTDNMTAYHITTSGSSKSPMLHALVNKIKHMELQLGCHLEVIHVPGTTMITQGTDGISRGVWLSPLLHDHQRSSSLLAALFAPIQFPPALIAWVVQANPDYSAPLTQTPWTHFRWDQNWVGRHLFHRFSIWTPPPEMASQTISFVLQAWVECPTTTSALFFIPRILQREWRKLSKHIVELVTLVPATNPAWPTVHLLPVTVLYLPKFVSCLLPPAHRLDESTLPSNARWHRQQADLLRGLPSNPDT